MSYLYITEGDRLLVDARGATIMALDMTGFIVEQERIAIGGSSTNSAPFSGRSRFIQVHSDASCSLLFGENPTAVVTKHRFGTNETRYYGVKPGEMVAVIANS